MAIHAHSTPVPAPQRSLLRDFAHPRDLAAQPVGNPDTLPSPAPLAAPESIAPQPCNSSGLAPEEALASTALTALLEPPEAAEARGLHSRRRLTEALEHGFALLDALDLPPLALDVIDDAIVALDALDAPREDLEPSLGWAESGPRFCGDYQDCELDIADWEPNLASPEHHPASPVCFSGGPYTARGGEESQLRWAQGARHDGETVNEDGDELDVGEHDETDKEPSLGWPNDYRAVLSPVLMADHDPEEVNEDGSDDGRQDHGWFAGEFDVSQVMRGMMEDARRQSAVAHV